MNPSAEDLVNLIRAVIRYDQALELPDTNYGRDELRFAEAMLYAEMDNIKELNNET